MGAASTSRGRRWLLQRSLRAIVQRLEARGSLGRDRDLLEPPHGAEGAEDLPTPEEAEVDSSLVDGIAEVTEALKQHPYSIGPSLLVRQGCSLPSVCSRLAAAQELMNLHQHSESQAQLEAGPKH